MELLEAVQKSTRKTLTRGEIINWQNVADLMGYGSSKSHMSAYRRRYVDKTVKNHPDEVGHPSGDRSDECLLEIRSDGTTISERKILMSETDMKDPRFVLTAHGFDPDKFKLISARNNFWITVSKDKGDLNNYQSRIVAEPIDPTEFTLADIEKVVGSFVYKHKAIKVIRTKGKYALEIDIADLHIASMSWARESGEDNDAKITMAAIQLIVAEMRALIKRLDIEKIYIIFLGDILQVDSEDGKTTGGTQVNLDGRPNKMIETAYDILIHIIDQLAIVETEVIAVQGNHSRMVEYAIMYSLPMIFRDNPHIHFNITPRLRTAFLYGSSLVGLMHGDMPKKRWFGWLHVEYREWWGLSKRAEIHAGHLHEERTEQSIGGTMLRFQRTSKPIDGWEYKEGYVGAEKGVMAYLWDADKGIKQTYYF